MLDFLKSAGKLPTLVKEDSEIPEKLVQESNTGESGHSEPEILAVKNTARDDRQTGGNYRQPSKLSNFSGDPNNKGEVSFDQWRWEVECHIHDALHSADSIRQAMRKALKGNAGGIAKRLGADASIQEILGKLDTVYGTVECGESLLAEFYAASQDKKEDVAAWSCRLEDLLDKAEEASLQQSRTAHERESMLRSRFWMGLQQNLKDSSRHKYDTIQNYDKLRVEIRQIEHEYKVKDKQGKDKGGSQAQVRMSAADAATGNEEATEQDSFRKLEAMVKKLTNQVGNMQNEFKNWKQKGNSNEGKVGTTSKKRRQGKKHPNRTEVMKRQDLPKAREEVDRPEIQVSHLQVLNVEAEDT